MKLKLNDFRINTKFEKTFDTDGYVKGMYIAIQGFDYHCGFDCHFHIDDKKIKLDIKYQLAYFKGEMEWKDVAPPDEYIPYHRYILIDTCKQTCNNALFDKYNNLYSNVILMITNLDLGKCTQEDDFYNYYGHHNNGHYYDCLSKYQREFVKKDLNEVKKCLKILVSNVKIITLAKHRLFLRDGI
jgi:hypothetical protein